MDEEVLKEVGRVPIKRGEYTLTEVQMPQGDVALKLSFTSATGRVISIRLFRQGAAAVAELIAAWAEGE